MLSSAVTFILITLSPSFSSSFPSIITVALSSSALASIFNSVTSPSTVAVYCVVSLSNAGVISIPSIDKEERFLLLDFSSSFSGLSYVIK